LVPDLLVLDAFQLAGGLLDRPLDHVLGHVQAQPLVDRRTQARIAPGVAPAGAGGDADLADDLGENLAALCVDGVLACFDGWTASHGSYEPVREDAPIIRFAGRPHARSAPRAGTGPPAVRPAARATARCGWPARCSGRATRGSAFLRSPRCRPIRDPPPTAGAPGRAARSPPPPRPPRLRSSLRVRAAAASRCAPAPARPSGARPASGQCSCR